MWERSGPLCKQQWTAPAVCGPSVSERLRVEPAVVLLSVFVHNTQTFAGGSVENVLSSRCLHSLAWSVRTRWDAN